jgi:membrane-associated protease RseP (regulator of RpoE activity)
MSDTKPLETDPKALPPPRPGAQPNESSYTKIRNEILAGGASDQEDQLDTVGGPRALVGMGLIVLLLGALAWWSWWSFVFVVLLLLCIFLHEAGHFVTARLTGMKATQFFLFMGPKLWSFRRGETEYGVRAYPVGAFVRIIGMNNLDEVDPADEPRAYRNQTYPRRMLVICAGSLMHMVIAIALLFGVYSLKGELLPSDQVSIIDVVAGSPAAGAGLLADDVVVSVDGRPVSTADQFVRQIQSHSPGDQATLIVARDGVQQSIQVGLGSNPNAGPDFGKAYIGTRSGELNTWHGMSVTRAATHSITGLGDGLWASVDGVVKVLNPVNIFTHVSGSNTDQSTQPTTVVGVSRFSDVVGGETGLGGVLIMLAGVNVFVGLLNLFPILPFDGGHAAIATYERLRSRKGQPAYRADIAKMVPVALTMMALLAFLMLAGLYLDIAKPIG